MNTSLINNKIIKIKLIFRCIPFQFLTIFIFSVGAILGIINDGGVAAAAANPTSPGRCIVRNRVANDVWAATVAPDPPATGKNIWIIDIIKNHIVKNVRFTAEARNSAAPVSNRCIAGNYVVNDGRVAVVAKNPSSHIPGVIVRNVIIDNNRTAVLTKNPTAGIICQTM